MGPDREMVVARENGLIEHGHAPTGENRRADNHCVLAFEKDSPAEIGFGKTFKDLITEKGWAREQHQRNRRPGRDERFGVADPAQLLAQEDFTLLLADTLRADAKDRMSATREPWFIRAFTCKLARSVAGMYRTELTSSSR